MHVYFYFIAAANLVVLSCILTKYRVCQPIPWMMEKQTAHKINKPYSHDSNLADHGTGCNRIKITGLTLDVFFWLKLGTIIQNLTIKSISFQCYKSIYTCIYDH